MSDVQRLEERSKPLVTVVIPTYNRAGTILPTLLSVQRQTFTNFECLVIDDGSEDVEELESVVARLDNRFRVLRKSNGGASSARNTGIQVARGEYIALLDSDDQFHPEKLELQLAAVSGHEEQPVLCYTQLLVDRGIGKHWVKPPRGVRAGERVDEYLMSSDGWIQTSTMLLTADIARHVMFSADLPSSQDTDFAIRVVNAGAELIFIPRPLVTMNDVYDPTRVSKQTKFVPLLSWIEKMRHAGQISERSYWAYRGWQIARIASYSDRTRGIRLYLSSLIRGAFRPKVALIVLAQVLIPQGTYQRIATFFVKIAGRR